VDHLSTIANRKGITVAQLCIAWVGVPGNHVVPLPGSSCVFFSLYTPQRVRRSSNRKLPLRVPQEREAYSGKSGCRRSGALDRRSCRDCAAVGEVSEEGRAIYRWPHGPAVAPLGLSVELRLEISEKREGVRRTNCRLKSLFPSSFAAFFFSVCGGPAGPYFEVTDFHLPLPRLPIFSHVPPTFCSENRFDVPSSGPLMIMLRFTVFPPRPAEDYQHVTSVAHTSTT